MSKIEERNRRIMEYNLAAMFGDVLKLIRDGELLASGAASLIRTGVDSVDSRMGDGCATVARAVLARSAFPMPVLGDRIEEADGTNWEVTGLGRFGVSSCEVMLRKFTQMRTGSI